MQTYWINHQQLGCCLLTLTNVKGVDVARVSLERATEVEAHSPLLTSTLSWGKITLSVLNHQHAQTVTADKPKTNQVWRFCSRKLSAALRFSCVCCCPCALPTAPRLVQIRSSSKSCSGSLRLATTMRSPPLAQLPKPPASRDTTPSCRECAQATRVSRYLGCCGERVGREGKRCSGNRAGWAPESTGVCVAGSVLMSTADDETRVAVIASSFAFCMQVEGGKKLGNHQATCRCMQQFVHL